ncbi:hypothetical protein [Suilimivivens sp.]|uniref:hypothetical protein n=1 Tax=Suilimivivens sp. TaxID=2981669 RepID=UPI00307AE84B
MLRHVLDGIATVGVILGVAGIAGVIEFGTSPVPCMIAISIGIGAGMLSSRLRERRELCETDISLDSDSSANRRIRTQRKSSKPRRAV